LKDVNGIWLPDHEQHLLLYAEKGEHGKWTYQAHKMLAALQHVKNCRVAVDIGGHCGLWSKELVKVFDKVIAFEPVAEHRACYEKNVQGNYELNACALGESEGMVQIHVSNGSSGDAWVDGNGDIPLKTLDSFNLENVDFMKLDCEGYELYALRGGEETIKRCHPVIIVEQKPGRGKKFGLSEIAAVDYLKTLGYKLKQEISDDYILA